MNNFFTLNRERFHYDAKFSADEQKLAFSNHDYIGISLVPNINTFIDGSSDHLVSVNVKTLLNFEEMLSKKYIENRYFTE